MRAPAHLQIEAPSGVLSPISCLKKSSRTTMVCLRSTLSSKGIGHRTPPPLQMEQVASVCLAEPHGPAMRNSSTRSHEALFFATYCGIYFLLQLCSIKAVHIHRMKEDTFSS